MSDIPLDRFDDNSKRLVPFDSLVGKVITAIETNDSEDVLYFYTVCDRLYMMFHVQDCCETVDIEDVCGEWEDIMYWPVHLAEERKDSGGTDDGDSVTWTFYEIQTIKGGVTIRWHGRSNGYYSESVSFYELPRRVIN